MNKQFIRKLNYISYLYVEKLSGKDIDSEEKLHNEVVASIFKIKDLIPEQYHEHSLERVIAAKSITFNTSLDKSVRQHFYLKKLMYKILKSKKISSNISSKIIDLKESRLEQSMIDKGFEDEFLLTNCERNFRKDQDKVNLLFFGSQPSHLKIFDSYLQFSYLKDFKLLIPHRLKDEVTLKQVTKEKIIIFEEYFPLNIEKELSLLIEEFTQIYHENISTLQNYFRFNGHNFFKTQRSGIKNIFSFLLPQSLVYSRTANTILEEFSFSSVIGVRPRRIFDRAILQKAKHLKVQTGLLIHSTLGSEPRELWSSGIYDSCDLVLGWGEKHLQLIKKDKLFDGCNFIKCGSPLFNSPPQKKEFKIDSPKIIYASTRNDDSIINALENYKKNNPNIHITIKLHPGDNQHNRINKDLFSVESGNFAIEEILPSFDLFITSYSGSHLSAISEGIPVIFTPFFYEFSNDLQTLYGINEKTMSHSYAKNTSIMSNFINRVIEESDYREKLLHEQQKYFTDLIEEFSMKESADKITQALNLS